MQSLILIIVTKVLYYYFNFTYLQMRVLSLFPLCNSFQIIYSNPIKYYTTYILVSDFQKHSIYGLRSFICAIILLKMTVLVD